ncbi:MAG TPA: O-antigen ligase family protein [Acidimicrobiales bacterium]|nr:O-antigen ligase family protein [Acidimicrobiales bacterium]
MIGDRMPAVAWAAAVLFAPLNGIRINRAFSVSDGLIAFAVVATATSPTSRRKIRDVTADRALLIGLGLLTLGALIGSIFAPHPWTSLGGTARFVFISLSSVVAVGLWAPSRGTLRRFCVLWLSGATANALWALVVSPTVWGRRAGLASHPNSLGLVCVLGTGLALGFCLSDRGIPRRVAEASCALLAVGVVLSGSRAALLGLVTAVPVVLVLSSRRRLVLPTVAATLLVGGAVLAGALHPPAHGSLGRLVGDRSTVESDASRDELLRRTGDRIKAHPLTGEGFQYAHEAHSIYLQALVAGGPLGLAGLALINGMALTAAWRALAARREAVTGDHSVLAGLAGGYAGYLVAAAFQNSLGERHVWLYLAGATALARELRPMGQGGPRTL